MSNNFDIVPAELNLTVVKGDEFGMTADFDIDLTGYANWTAIVFETAFAVSPDFPGGVHTQGNTGATFTVSITSAANGQLNLSLTETQTTGLKEQEAYRWFLRGEAPGTVTRTFISGTFRVRAP